MSLNEQVTEMHKEAAVKQMNGVQGKAQKSLKMDLVGDKYGQLVLVARGVAEELGARGPVTIDDVTFSMAEHHNVLPRKGKEQRWKGKVFADKTKWICVGNRPALLKTSHGRQVRAWALKEWLQNNPQNGIRSDVSSFVLSRLFTDFIRTRPGIDLSSCRWEIGSDRLAPEIRASIESDRMHLYGVPVTFIPVAVGAIIRG